MKGLIIAASIFWTTTHLSIIGIRIMLFRIYRENFHLYFALASLLMASWGISLLWQNELIIFINGVVTPILASLSLFIATFKMIKHFAKK